VTNYRNRQDRYFRQNRRHKQIPRELRKLPRNDEAGNWGSLASRIPLEVA
jgi:hypothetical protein